MGKYLESCSYDPGKNDQRTMAFPKKRQSDKYPTNQEIRND